MSNATIKATNSNNYYYELLPCWNVDTEFIYIFKSFILKNDAYHFFTQFRESQLSGKILYEDLPILKQVGLARILMALSCTDLRWNELISWTTILNEKDLDNKSINKLDFF